MRKLANLKGMLGLLIVGLLVGCNSLHRNDVSYSETENPIFTQALAEEDWVQDEYSEYKSRRGYKAFAISILNGHVYATGFGDDKVTMELAENEALRMCAHFSQGVGECQIMDKAESEGDHGLTEAEIESAPEQLIAHRDIHHYLRYQAAEAPKAFVAAVCSGQAFWVSDKKSKEQAEQLAMQSCENGRHPSDPCCTLLTSE